MTQKDNDNAISEKLSQNDADVVTKRQASEMEKRAASYYASSMFETFQKTCNNLTWGATIEERDARIKRVEDSILSYREAYDYAKSIGAIE